MAESLSLNNVTLQTAREDILNNERRESLKSYMALSYYFVEFEDNPMSTWLVIWLCSLYTMAPNHIVM